MGPVEILNLLVVREHVTGPLDSMDVDCSHLIFESSYYDGICLFCSSVTAYSGSPDRHTFHSRVGIEQNAVRMVSNNITFMPSAIYLEILPVHPHHKAGDIVVYQDACRLCMHEQSCISARRVNVRTIIPRMVCKSLWKDLFG